MFTKLGHFDYRHAKVILIVAACLVVAASLIGFKAVGKLQSGGFDNPKSQSTIVQNLINQKFGGQDNVVFLVHALKGNVNSSAMQAEGIALTDKLTENSDLSGVSSYWQTQNPELRSSDSRYAIIVAHITGSDQQVSDRTKTLVSQYATTSPNFTVRLGGEGPVSNDITQQVGKSLGIAEGIAIPLTLILLLLAFGTVVAGLLPLIMGLVAIVGTFAELYILGSITNVSVYAINLTTALGLGLAIDYGLFIVSRYREQLKAGDDYEGALVKSLETAGHTIVFSAAALCFALAALIVFPLYFLQSFAYAGIGVAIISVLSALIILPALLAVLGKRIEKRANYQPIP